MDLPDSVSGFYQVRVFNHEISQGLLFLLRPLMLHALCNGLFRKPVPFFDPSSPDLPWSGNQDHTVKITAASVLEEYGRLLENIG